MSIAMLIALLLQSGACAQTQFQGPDGATLNVVVCPMMTPAGAEPEAPPAPEAKRRRT
jgi:hypothetical protein